MIPEGMSYLLYYEPGHTFCLSWQKLEPKQQTGEKYNQEYVISIFNLISFPTSCGLSLILPLPGGTLCPLWPYTIHYTVT